MSNLRSRGYLPHIEHEDSIYFVTFRLAGSLPKKVLEDMEFERTNIIKTAKQMGRPLSEYELGRLRTLYSEKIESYLDRGAGECWLRNAPAASIVVEALKLFAWHKV